MTDTSAPPDASVAHRRKNKKKTKKIPAAKIMRSVPKTERAKVTERMRKVFRKRAREYHSDSDSEDEHHDDEEAHVIIEEEETKEGGEVEKVEREGEGEGDEDDHIQTGVMKFTQGCDAFRLAFLKITKRRLDEEALGPVLAANKKLVVAKLAEEEEEKKVKKETTKLKHLVAEKGHVKLPFNFLDTHDKVLLGIATKGVVKFFNAVSKAQMAQKGLNPSRYKDAKVLTKRRKEAFMSELSKASGQSVEATTKTSTSSGKQDDNQPGWAPLRDTFMLTNSKLKDWDKMAEDETEMDI